MKAKLRQATLIAASSLAVTTIAPARAQTAPDAATDGHGLQSNWELSAAFVADAFPDIHFLDQTSRMAIAHSKSEKIRDFAQQVAKEETTVGNSLIHWLRASEPLGPDDRSSVRLVVRMKAPRMLPSQANSLQRLSSREGRDFDTMYVSMEKDALQHLATACNDYVQNGGDPGLKAIAAHELPEVKQLISTLGSL